MSQFLLVIAVFASISLIVKRKQFSQLRGDIQASLIVYAFYAAYWGGLSTYAAVVDNGSEFYANS